MDKLFGRPRPGRLFLLIKSFNLIIASFNCFPSILSLARFSADECGTNEKCFLFEPDEEL